MFFTEWLYHGNMLKISNRFIYYDSLLIQCTALFSLTSFLTSCWPFWFLFCFEHLNVTRTHSQILREKPSNTFDSERLHNSSCTHLFTFNIILLFYSFLICGPSKTRWTWRILPWRRLLFAARRPPSPHPCTGTKPRSHRRRTPCTSPPSLYSDHLSSEVTVKLLMCPPVGLSHQITNLIWIRLPGPPLHSKTPWRNTALCGPWWEFSSLLSYLNEVKTHIQLTDAWPPVWYSSFDTVNWICLSFGSLKPPTPNLEEDLKEVLRREAGIELIVEDETPTEKKRKQVVRQQTEKK